MAKNNPNANRPAGRPGGATAASGASRREALRQQQEAQAARERRNRLLVVLAALLAAILVIGAIVFAVVHHNNQKNAAKANAITPPNAVTGSLSSGGTGPVGIAVKGNSSASTSSSVPTLYEYQDYQCPVCKVYATAYGPVFNKLASEGKINLQYRTLTFLDQNERNDSSTRSAIAAACADTVGAFEKYHDVVYANQPAQEGQGYTDQQLRADFASQAGITGANLTTFQKCYDDRATSQFVTDTNNNGDNNLTGNKLQISTPQFFVDKDGKPSTVNLPAPTTTQPTEDDVLKAIKAAS